MPKRVLLLLCETMILQRGVRMRNGAGDEAMSVAAVSVALAKGGADARRGGG